MNFFGTNFLIGFLRITFFLTSFLGLVNTFWNFLKGVLSAAVRLLPRTPKSSGFVVAGYEVQIGVTSVAGACGVAAGWTWPPVGSGAEQVAIRFRFCEGSEVQYQVDLAGTAQYQAVITDLGNPGARYDVSGFGATTHKMTRPAAQWVLSTQETSLLAGAVVNAASFTPDIAPGGLIAVFGAGLARGNSGTSTEVDGAAGKAVALSPFQVNAQSPASVAAGMHTLRLASPYGAAEIGIEVKDVAPALFQLAGGRGAVLNQDGKLNTEYNPLSRGQVMVLFGTGLGSVSRQGSLMTADRPVTVLISGRELPAAFAGLTPGFVGLYQVNVSIPVSATPGLALPVSVRQADAQSNPVLVAVQ